MSPEELNRMMVNCGCGTDHTRDGTGECDVPALVARVRELEAERALFIGATEIRLVQQPLPESEMIRTLQRLLEDAYKTIALYRQASGDK